MMSLSLTVLAQTVKPPVYNENQNTILVSTAQPVFSLQLKSNPTTGYRWDLKSYDKKLIKLVENHYVAPNSHLIGAGGYEVWTFKALPAALQSVKQTAIEMEYKRPWQGGEVGSTLTFNISLR